MARNRLSRLKGRALARIDAALGYRDLKRRHRMAVGRDPDLVNPTTFAEKVHWRQLHDRNPLWPVCVDKHAARGLAAQRLGDARAAQVLPPLIWHGTDPAALPFDRMQEGAAIKATHGCGWNILLAPGEVPDRTAIQARAARWMRSCFAQHWHEWAYGEVPPALIVEQLVQQEDGSTVHELKLFTFGGEVALMGLIDFGGPTIRHQMMRPDWTRAGGEYHLGLGPNWPAIGPVPRPPYLDELLEVGRAMAAGTDMLRVDFLIARHRFWLGELTVYPASGNCRFTPAALDREMGARWILPRQATRA